MVSIINGTLYLDKRPRLCYNGGSPHRHWESVPLHDSQRIKPIKPLPKAVSAHYKRIGRLGGLATSQKLHDESFREQFTQKVRQGMGVNES